VSQDTEALLVNGACNRQMTQGGEDRCARDQNDSVWNARPNGAEGLVYPDLPFWADLSIAPLLTPCPGIFTESTFFEFKYVFFPWIFTRWLMRGLGGVIWCSFVLVFFWWCSGEKTICWEKFHGRGRFFWVRLVWPGSKFLLHADSILLPRPPHHQSLGQRHFYRGDQESSTFGQDRYCHYIKFMNTPTSDLSFDVFFCLLDHNMGMDFLAGPCWKQTRRIV